MKEIKIVFFDVDGTLIPMGAKQLPQRMRHTLTRLREQGIKLCVATGRGPCTLPDFAQGLFDAYLTYNGAYCYDEQGVIFNNPIAPEEVQQLLRNAEALGRPVSIAIRGGLAANGSDEDLATYYTFANLQLEVDEDFHNTVQQDVYQVMLGCRKSDYPAILKDVANVKITGWWERASDVIPANGGKGTAIRQVLAHYGLDPENALAFGDGNNDLEMLQTVGTGVAMGNASQELKEIADAVCGKASEDGIYHYCLSHGLI